MKSQLSYNGTFWILCAVCGAGLAWYRSHALRYGSALSQAVLKTEAWVAPAWKGEEMAVLDRLNRSGANALSMLRELQEYSTDSLRNLFLAIAYKASCEDSELALCAAVLEEWTRRNPSEVLDCLYGDPHLAARFPSAVKYAFTTMARADPHATRAYVDKVGLERCSQALSEVTVKALATADMEWATGPLLRHVGVNQKVFRALLEHDGAATMAALQQFGTPLGRANLVVAAGEWLTIDRNAALAWLKSESSAIRQKAFYQAVQEGVEFSSADLKTFAPVTQDMMRMQMRNFYMPQESAKALELAASLQGHERTWALQEVAVACGASEIGQKALELIGSYDRVTEVLAALGTKAIRDGSNPAEVNAWLDNLSAREQAVVVPRVLGIMALKHPDFAAAQLSTLRDSTLVHSACGNIIDVLQRSAADLDRQKIIQVLAQTATPQVLAAFREELSLRGLNAGSLGVE